MSKDKPITRAAKIKIITVSILGVFGVIAGLYQGASWSKETYWEIHDDHNGKIYITVQNANQMADRIVREQSIKSLKRETRKLKRKSLSGTATIDERIDLEELEKELDGLNDEKLKADG